MFQERYMSTREREEGDEDEFFKYYRQYRPSPPPHYTSSVASSEEFMSTDNVSSSSSAASQFRNTIQHFLSFPGKRMRRLPPRPIRSRSEETGTSTSSRLVLQKQPLSLEGRAYLSSPREDGPSASFKRTHEETLSRDSGHSSGGSPDFRSNPRRRRIVRQKYITEEYPPKEDEAFRNWSSHLDSWDLELQTSPPTPSQQDKGTQVQTQRTKGTKDERKEGCSWLSLFILSVPVFLLLALGIKYIRVLMCHHNRTQGFNIQSLRQDLEENLFGQHIAQKEILSAVSTLQGHQVSVLVFMGSPGSGKTHAANILRRGFPLPGNVHYFSAPIHLASHAGVLSTLEDLNHEIKVSCGHSLVIFDDIDFLAEDNSEHIASFIASLEINSLSSRRRSNGTIVVISSVSGGTLINEQSLTHAKKGLNREEMVRQDFQVLESNSPLSRLFEVLKKRGMGVVVVPFLPLARTHVRECIVRESALQNMGTSAYMNDILEGIPFFPKDFPMFSSEGCKRIARKVIMHKGGVGHF